MANPASAFATIDFVDSGARLRGDAVEVVLAVTEDIDENAKLVLSKDGVSVSAPIEVTGSRAARRVVARIPRSRLTDGIWTLSLASNAGPDADPGQAVDARLLVQGSRPTVLLLGATTPRSLVPSRKPTSAAGTVAPSNKQKVARTGGRVLDGALRVLKPEQAAKVRSRARALTRRALR
jgi:hypothetical protein